LIHGGFVFPFNAPVAILKHSPSRPFGLGDFLFMEDDMTMDLVKIPPLWMAEAKQAYAQYKQEWEREETERVLGTGDDPEPAQDWPSFFSEYLYAELENSVYVDIANGAIAGSYE
jgi:hypothetical protein